MVIQSHAFRSNPITRSLPTRLFCRSRRRLAWCFMSVHFPSMKRRKACRVHSSTCPAPPLPPPPLASTSRLPALPSPPTAALPTLPSPPALPTHPPMLSPWPAALPFHSPISYPASPSLHPPFFFFSPRLFIHLNLFIHLFLFCQQHHPPPPLFLLPNTSFLTNSSILFRHQPHYHVLLLCILRLVLGLCLLLLHLLFPSFLSFLPSRASNRFLP